MLVSRRLGGRRPIDWPSIRISPASRGSNPPMARRVVVLPQPEGPSSEKNSPPRTWNETASTAVTSPKRLVIARTSTPAPVIGRRSARRGVALHPGLDFLLPALAPLARLLAHGTPVEPDRALQHLGVQGLVYPLGHARLRERRDVVGQLGVAGVVLGGEQLGDDFLGHPDLV